MQLYSADINILRDINLETNPINSTEEPSILLEYYSRNGTSSSVGSGITALFATAAVNSGTAPDGTSTASSLTEDTNTVYHSAFGNMLNTSNGITNALTFFAKAGTRNKCWVDCAGSGGADPAIINLLDGSIIQAPSTNSVLVTDVGNGWFKINYTFTYDSGAFSTDYAIGTVNASNQIQYLGNGTGSILFWGINDWMNRPFASSAITSTANQAGSPPPTGFPDPAENNFGTGRWLDSSLQIPLTALPQAMSGLIEFIEKGTSLTPGAGIWSIGDYVLASPSLQLGTGASGYRIIHNNGGNVTSSLAAFPAIGDLVRLRWTLRADGSVQIWQSINGAAEVAAASSAASSLAVAWSEGYSWLNGLGAGNQGFIAFRQSVVLPGADISLIDLLSHFT